MRHRNCGRLFQSGRAGALGFLILISGAPVASAETGADANFFQGKTITISTFTPPGGSYDSYSRMLARRISEFIPGRPTMVVVNQPGAGGLLALNYAGRVAPRDGTFLTLAGVGMLLQGALGGAGLQVSLRCLLLGPHRRQRRSRMRRRMAQSLVPWAPAQSMRSFQLRSTRSWAHD